MNEITCKRECVSVNVMITLVWGGCQCKLIEGWWKVDRARSTGGRGVGWVPG